MDKNIAAENVLNEFILQNNPGYAILVDARWGAGKTYFIKSVLNLNSSTDVRYISLNGVDDRGAFRRALISGLSISKLHKAAESVGNILGKTSGAGQIGSVVRETVEDIMIKNLPRILVFDDIERSALAPSVLFGLINDFIGHEGRNVICVAHSKAHDENSEFHARKEKIIGRVISIEADANSAIPVFMSDMPEGKGKIWIEKNVHYISEIFKNDKSQNLRILKKSIHEWGRLVDILEPDLLEAQNAMLRLMRTYLPLSIALTQNEIKESDLLSRSKIEAFSAAKDEKRVPPFKELLSRHAEAEIYTGNAASILPEAL